MAKTPQLTKDPTKAGEGDAALQTHKTQTKLKSRASFRFGKDPVPELRWRVTEEVTQG